MNQHQSGDKEKNKFREFFKSNKQKAVKFEWQLFFVFLLIIIYLVLEENGIMQKIRAYTVNAAWVYLLLLFIINILYLLNFLKFMFGGQDKWDLFLIIVWLPIYLFCSNAVLSLWKNEFYTNTLTVVITLASLYPILASIAYSKHDKTKEQSSEKTEVETSTKSSKS